MLEAAAVSEPTIRHMEFADGTLARCQVYEGMEPILPEGARYVDEDEYETLRAEQDARHDARLAELHATEAKLRREQYEDLAAAGVRESTARALSGYDGPPEGA
ncbi:hypothetical protein [Streptomyces sp. NPDC088847]|uniref:hypothetical protein n=1 Tax=Streptomyces sp. NPDC088847 TaxID=3365909 RepID=UPI0037F1F7DE